MFYKAVVVPFALGFRYAGLLSRWYLGACDFGSPDWEITVEA
jgi:hypothetical protein